MKSQIQNIRVNEEIHGLESQQGEKLLTFDEKLGFALRSSPIGLIVTDEDGTIIAFNRTLQDLLDIHIDDYKDTNVVHLYAHPEDRQRLLKTLAEKGSIRDFEVQVKHKNGTLRDVLANIDDVCWNKRRVLLTSIYDITQYKQSKIEADKNYHALFSNAPVGITVTDYAGHVIVSNNALKELLGYTTAEMAKINFQDLYLLSDDRRKLVELTKKLGSVRDFETKIKHKSKTVITVLINVDIIEFGGRQNMLLKSIRDISPLKQIEDELTKERDFSNAILNIAATLIIVIDVQGHITRINRAFEQISGYAAQDIQGTLLRETNLFEQQITRQELEGLLKKEIASTYETDLIAKDGGKHHITWTFAALRSADGSISNIIATGLDITKRQKAEEALKIANLKLEAWVQDLQQRTEEMRLVNELGEKLQISQTVTGACETSAHYIQQICPKSNGALYLVNPEEAQAQAEQIWGLPVLTKEVFSATQCMAVQERKPYLVDERHPGKHCGHIIGHKTGQYLCVPLMLNGMAIGMLHLNNSKAGDDAKPEDQSYNNHKMQLITMIADYITLAISNIRLKETLRQQSIRDSLTGLFNRRYMEEMLERELDRAKREQRPVGIIMFDIDHYKDFNDLEGHDAGDALLRELGAYLLKETRGGDIVCRYGGEEFLVVLPGATMEDVAQRAEQMRRDVSGLTVEHLGKTLPKCTISLGVAVYPGNGQTSENLLKAVDNALYQAKDEGRNCVVRA